MAYFRTVTELPISQNDKGEMATLSAAQASFCETYRQHLQWMLHTVRRLGVLDSDAEDVAHDVFGTAWNRLDTYASGRPMRPWLFGIAFRVVSNRKATKRSKEELADTFDTISGVRQAPDEILEGEDARRHVLHALNTLPVEQRALFVGADIDQVPITELAEHLGIPLNTAYSRLRLARSKFQATFNELQNEVRR